LRLVVASGEIICYYQLFSIPMHLRILQRLVTVVLLTALVVLSFGFSASAQQSSAASANVTATVLDATGAAWVRADVVLIDTRTLKEQRGSSDEKGEVRFPSVNPGNYLVIAAPPPADGLC
jgi:Carboxypeptidase regulatory-like domain